MFPSLQRGKDTVVQSQRKLAPEEMQPWRRRRGGEREGGSDGERERMRRREVIRKANLSEQQRESLGRG